MAPSSTQPRRWEGQARAPTTGSGDPGPKPGTVGVRPAEETMGATLYAIRSTTPMTAIDGHVDINFEYREGWTENMRAESGIDSALRPRG